VLNDCAVLTDRAALNYRAPRVGSRGSFSPARFQSIVRNIGCAQSGMTV